MGLSQAAYRTYQAPRGFQENTRTPFVLSETIYPRPPVIRRQRLLNLHLRLFNTIWTVFHLSRPLLDLMATTSCGKFRELIFDQEYVIIQDGTIHLS